MTQCKFEVLNKKMVKKYSTLKKEYPLSFHYLDTELRLLEGDAKYRFAHKQNIRKIARTTLVEIALSHIYFSIIRLYYVLFPRYKTAIFLNIERQKELSDSIVEEFIGQGKRTYKIPLSIIDIFKLDKFLFFGKLVLSDLGLHRLNLEIEYQGLENLIRKQEFLANLELVLTKRIMFAENLLKLLNISGLIMQNEHSFHEKIITKAAKNLNIKVVVVAHGYVTSEALITIAPINADHLVVWTNSQLSALNKKLGYPQSVLKYFGWPFRKLNVVESSGLIKPLLILCNFDVNLSDCEFKKTVNFIEEVAKIIPNIRIRMHPATKISQTSRAKIILQRFGKHISNNELNIDLINCNIVFGHDSSALVTSAINGILTYRFAETTFSEIPEVSILSMEEIIKELESKKLRNEKREAYEIGDLSEVSRKIVELF